MIKVKNVRPGIVIIADAGLKLTPGETRDIEKLTPQASRALEDGLLAVVEPQHEAKPRQKSSAKSAGRQSPEAREEPTATGVTSDGDGVDGVS